MASLLLISRNEREKQILGIAFDQLKIEVIEAKPDHASYIQALQFKPDVVVIEFPRYYQDHLNFCRNIKNIKDSKILIIGYGRDFPVAEKKAILESGVKEYLSRPLKFSRMMKIIEGYFNSYFPEKMTWKKSNKTDNSYIDKLFDRDYLPTKKLDLMAERIESLMAFPFTVAQVLKLTNDPTSGAGDLAKVIEADPVIAANVLKMSNTVFFASRNSKKITDIKSAIVRIGFKETKHIVMTMSVMNSLSTEADSLGFIRKEFWKHSLSVAIICENVAKQLSGFDSSLLFLSGLLHAFGIILFDEFFPDVFLKLLKATANKASSFHDTEQNEMVITHLDLSRRLFDSWKIPSPIGDGIFQSEKLSQFITDDDAQSRNSLQPEQMIGLIVNTADNLSKACQFGGECDQFVKPIDKKILNMLNKKDGFNLSFVESVQNEMVMYCKFLKLKGEPNFNGTESISPAIFLEEKNNFYPIQGYFLSRSIKPRIFTSLEQIKEWEKMDFDLIIYCAKDNGKTENINFLKTVVPSGDREHMPIIVFEDTPAVEKDEHVHFLAHSLDLRYADMIIQQIMHGESQA